jgi:hypothetical protein
MRWTKKSDIENGDMYCCIHNVDCPEQGNSDAEVLIVNPSRRPTSWMCAEAVLEISDHEGLAQDKI